MSQPFNSCDVNEKQGGGLDWDKLDDIRRKLGIKDAPPEEAEAMIAAFHDPALSRRVLGLEEEEE